MITKTQTVVTATNKKKYIITGDKQVKALKVNDLKRIPDILDMESLNIMSQLKAIYGYLKDKDDSTVLKSRSINCRGYKMGYTASGFTIYDTKNYGKKTDFENPVPTPREVWEYISKINSVDVAYVNSLAEKMKAKDIAAKKKKRELIEQGKLTAQNKLSQREIEKLSAEKPIEQKREDVTVEQLEAIRKKLIRMVKSSKKATNVIDKMNNAVPHRGFIVLYNKLLRKLKRNEIRAPKFLKEVLELLQEIDFTPKPVRAPKFAGVDYPKITELYMDGTTVNYKTKNGSYSCSETELYCRFLLHDLRTMPQLMKLIRGKITEEQFLENDTEKDIYEDFDLRLIKQQNDLVSGAIKKLLKSRGDYTPFITSYQNDVNFALKVGDTILIQLLDSCSEVKAKVISIDDGIELRNEYGEIIYLLKHQQWEKL